jgi:hypothetical protein
MELSYNIGVNMYTHDELSEILLCATPYNQVKIRITFLDKPKIDDEFDLVSRHYILSLKHRKTDSTVYNKNTMYKDGVCLKI